MRLTLILATLKRLMAAMTSVTMLKKAQNIEIMMERNLTPIDLKKHDLTENHAGADGALAQMIKMK